MKFYFPFLFLVIHLLVSILICLLLLTLTFFFSKFNANFEKNMAYECGFKPFEFEYYPFDIQFYRIGILFLIFDVEILYLFPWVINFYEISNFGHFSVFFFICVLFFGFLYEVYSGTLFWYPQTKKIFFYNR